MKRLFGSILKITWSIAMIAVAIWWAIQAAANAGQVNVVSESHHLVLLVLILLSFPVGLGWIALISLGLSVTGTLPEADLWLAAIIWIGFFASGWLQWFILLPWLAKWITSKFSVREQ